MRFAKHLFISAALLLGLQAPTLAEEFQLLALPFAWRSQVSTDLSYEVVDDATLSSGSELGIQRTLFESTIRLRADDTWTVLAEIDADLIDFDLESTSGAESSVLGNADDMTGVKVGLAARYIDEAKRRWVGSLAIGSRSTDLKDDDQARIWGAFAGVYLPDGDHNGWTLGLRYQSSASFPLPLVAYTWVHSKDLRISLGLPFVAVHWKPDERWTVNMRNFATSPGVDVSYMFVKKWYAYTHIGRAGWSGYQADRVDEDWVLRNQSWRAGAGLRFKLYPGTQAELEFGSEFDREFELRDGGDVWADDEATEDLGSAWYVRLRTQVAF